MPYYDVPNLVTVTGKIPRGYERTTAVRIQHHVSHRAAQLSRVLMKYHAKLHTGFSFSQSHLPLCAEVSGAPKFDYSISQIS
jgi:hypothetical protein